MMDHLAYQIAPIQNIIKSSRWLGNYRRVYIHPDSDSVAHEDAEKTRQHSIAIIRSHLEEFLQQHPKATFQEWITSLHPENVKDNVLDDRFLIENNPWLLVWLETTKTAPQQCCNTKGGEDIDLNINQQDQR